MPGPYGPRSAEDLGQGDLLKDISFYSRSADEDPTLRVHHGLVTSHSCDCDKFVAHRRKHPSDTARLVTWPVFAAPVSQLALLPRDLQGDVRAGRVPRFFYLPADGPFQLEHVADLWYEQPVPYVVLERASLLTTLSEEMIETLHAHLMRLRTRRVLLDDTGEAQG